MNSSFNYLAFVTGTLTHSSNRAFHDGLELAGQCLKKLEAIEPATEPDKQFPPKLLILLASLDYLQKLNAEHLVAGVHQRFAEAGQTHLPLIGGTVSALFFDRRIHEHGAILICLSSRLMEASVAVSTKVRTDPRATVTEVLDELKLNFTGTGADPNPLVNRLLLTFFPGFAKTEGQGYYPAPELHRLMREAVRARVPIVGGTVSSGPCQPPEGARRAAALQFANDRVCTDALVAARIITAFPFTSSIGHGLPATGRFLRIKRLGDNSRTIFEFEEGVPAEVLGLEKEGATALLGELSHGRDPMLAIARLAKDNQSVRTLRPLAPNICFEDLTPHASSAPGKTVGLLEQSIKRLRLENPIACFGIICQSRQPLYREFDKLAAEVEALGRNGLEYVGGFFDGEAGMDETGRSVYNNWCEATLCLGDEMRERTPLQRGFYAIGQLRQISQRTALTEGIERTLRMIRYVGYPGAMVSLVLDDREEKWIVAREAIGARFRKISDQTQRPLSGKDVLAIVAREQQPRFIPDSRDPVYCCDEGAVKKSGIVSQYVIPLMRLNQTVIGLLQVDLGDVTYKEHLNEGEEQVLKSLGEVVSASINRILNWMEAKIARDLGEKLKDCLSRHSLEDALQVFIEETAKIFQVEMAHIRLADPDQPCLRAVAGIGAYYEALRKPTNTSSLSRLAIDIGDASPTCKAFKTGQTFVVNHADANPDFQAFRQRFAEEPFLHHALGQFNSYANLAFSDEGGTPLGTINLASRRDWFFTRAQVNALTSLAQRLGHLVSHFQRKEKEEQERKRFEFLHLVGSNFSRNVNFKDPIGVLKQVTSRFCKAANADVASLFLWDEESRKFILRAEQGWSNPNWVDGARYAEHERWTGSVALETAPRYIQDLYLFKQETMHQDVSRFYASQVFGTNLSETFTVEAIGIPLRLREKRLGVLTLFRRTDSTRPDQSGFKVKEPELLREAGDALAEMIGALLTDLRLTWEQRERERREAVHKALIQGPHNKSLESKLCEQFSLSFRTLQNSLFLFERAGDPDSLYQAAVYRRIGKRPTSPLLPDEQVKQAASTGKLIEVRHKIAQQVWVNPEEARTEDLIERVCLPLFDGEEMLGILDLRWGVRHRKASSLLTPHNPEALEVVGRLIGSAYRQQKLLLKRQEHQALAERGNLAVQAMGAMVFQSAHRLLNLVQSLKTMPDLLANAQNNGEFPARIESLEKLINSASEKIEHPMAIARRMRNVTPQPHHLKQCLETVLEELRSSNFNPQIEASLIVPGKLIAQFDFELVREAFHNIMDNAFKAMTPQGGVLTIIAVPLEDRKQVQITFKDTGPGMTEEEKNAALQGFVANPSNTGSGVLVSRLLLIANDGELEIESKKGLGTNVIVTLPLNPTE